MCLGIWRGRKRGAWGFFVTEIFGVKNLLSHTDSKSHGIAPPSLKLELETSESVLHPEASGVSSPIPVTVSLLEALYNFSVCCR